MDRSDVFLSYRRTDVEFTQKLYGALKETGRELWVDWEDIPPGVEGFSDEIRRGIEGADVFIPVLSPSYLQSEYCLMELREALKLKKRVIPVVLQKFDPLPAPEGVGHINWVYFTPHAGQVNNFEQSFPKVVQAIEADYDHVREHTRLLLRVVDWDNHKRDNSYLMKGAEIDAAEHWQVAAINKNPTPTETQGEYILISRRQQRKQQQQIMVAIGFLLVIAAIAAVIAFIQAGIATDAKNKAVISENDARTQQAYAVTQQFIAENQKATAEAAKIEADKQRANAVAEALNARISSLAAQSQLVQSRQLGILLALQAFKLSPQMSPAVQTSLRKVMVDFGGLPVHYYQKDSFFVDYSPDGHWLVSGGSGSLQLSRVNTGEVAAPITLENSGNVSNVVFSPDNAWLASINSDNGTIQLWSLIDFKTAPITLALPEGESGSACFAFGNPHSKQYWFAAGFDDGSVYYWDAHDLTRSAPALLKRGNGVSVSGITFSQDPGGRWLAVSYGYDSQSAQLFIWKMMNTNLEPFALELKSSYINMMLFSKSGKWLAVSTSNDNTEDVVKLWNMDLAESNPTPEAFSFPAGDMAFSPDDHWLALAADRVLKIWDLRNLAKKIDVPGYHDVVLAVTFSPDSRWLATGDWDGNIRLWKTQDFSLDSLKSEMAQQFNGFDVIVRSVKFNFNGTQLAAAGDQQVRVWNLPASLAEPIKVGTGNYGIDLASIKNWLILQANDYSLAAIDLRKDHPSAEIMTSHANPIGFYYMTPDEHYLEVIGEKQVQVWDLNNPASPLFDPPALRAGEGHYTSPDITADERWFIYAIGTQIFAVDLQNPATPIITLSGNSNAFPINALYPIGQWLISVSDSQALAWDVNNLTGAPITLSDLKGSAYFYTDDVKQSDWLFAQQNGNIYIWNIDDLSQAPTEIYGESEQDIIKDRWMLTQLPDGEYRFWDLTALQEPVATFIPNAQSSSNDAVAFYDNDGNLQVIILNDTGVRFIPIVKAPSAYYWGFTPDTQSLVGSVYSQDTNSYSTVIYDLTNLGSPKELPDVRVFRRSNESFSADSHWLVLRDKQNNTVLYDFRKHEQSLKSFPRSLGVAFSPDGRWLSLILQENNSTTALLVVLSNPDQTFKLTGHTDNILGQSFTPDNKHLMTSSYDGTIRIWDLENLKNDPIVLRHEAPIFSGNFNLTPDGKWLLVKADQILHIWSMDFNAVVNTACEVVGRNMTRAEWKKYLGDLDFAPICSQWPVEEVPTPTPTP